MANSQIKISSNKSFGVVFSIFFILVTIYIFYKTNQINAITSTLAIIFLLLGLFNSIILTPLNFVWFKFGILLSRIVSPLVMLMIFFAIVTPLAILAKIVRKDFLNIDKKKNMIKSTYWIEKEKYENSMKDQF